MLRRRAPGALPRPLLVVLLVLAAAVGCTDAARDRSAAPSVQQPSASGSSGSTGEPDDLLTPTSSPVAVPEQASGGPNIVLITTDDQTAEEMRWMPRTRRLLGEQGATFPEMLSPHPLCCPARAEMITGQYAQNNGVHTNAGPYGGLQALQDRDNTLGAWLQGAGYRTGMVGKYLNGYQGRDGIQHGWDFWDAAFGDLFGYYGFTLAGNGEPQRYDDSYSTDVVRDETLGLVEEWSGEDRPFFIWSSYYAPHGVCDGSDESRGCEEPPVPAPRHEGLHAGVRAPVLDKPSFNEPDMSDKPRGLRRLQPVAPREVQTLFQRRIESLAAVDEAVAATVRALEEAGELDDTVLLFTSDNGFLLGEHRYVGKTLAHDESVRVPLLVRGPGVLAGSQPRQTVTTVDLAPTIVGLAGATAGRVMDGRDLMPYARQELPAEPRTVLVQAGPRGRDADAPPWLFRGVRTERYTYVRWRAVQPGFVELYDRVSDPYELRNLARDPRYRKVVAELARRTGLLQSCAGEDCHRSFRLLPDVPVR